MFDGSEGHNAHFAGVDNRGSRVHAERAKVGDGDGAVRHSFGSCLAVARGDREVFEANGELLHIERVSLFNVRNDESARCRGGDAEVHVVVNNDVLIRPG